MSSDTKAIIGTVVGTGLVVAGMLAGVMYALIAGVNNRIDDVNGRIDDVRISLTVQIDGLSTRVDDMGARMDRIETRLDGFDERLRNVEIAFGKVDQRLLTLERVLLPPREPAGE